MIISLDNRESDIIGICVYRGSKTIIIRCAALGFYLGLFVFFLFNSENGTHVRAIIPRTCFDSTADRAHAVTPSSPYSPGRGVS